MSFLVKKIIGGFKDVQKDSGIRDIVVIIF